MASRRCDFFCKFGRTFYQLQKITHRSRLDLKSFLHPCTIRVVGGMHDSLRSIKCRDESEVVQQQLLLLRMATDCRCRFLFKELQIIGTSVFRPSALQATSYQVHKSIFHSKKCSWPTLLSVTAIQLANPTSIICRIERPVG